MQALAATLGRSPMSLYRYFDNKQAVLQALLRDVYADLLRAMRSRVEQHDTPQLRHRALLEAFVDFWESCPAYYELVYQTSAPAQRPEQPMPAALMPYYGEVVALATAVTTELADALDAGHERVRLATELRFALLMGYLQARFANPRYPWGGFQALRQACVDAVMDSVPRCLSGTLGHETPPSPQRATPRSRSR